MMKAEAVYTTRFAANRARLRDHADDADKWDVAPGDDGRFRVVPRTEPKSKSKALAHPNATRAAEAKRTSEKAATKKAAKANGAKGGKRAEILAAAQAGKLPAVPDFSAETHKRFRPKLAELIALVKAGDIKGLKAYPINPISTSPKAMDRYRTLAVIALEAQAKG